MCGFRKGRAIIVSRTGGYKQGIGMRAVNTSTLQWILGLFRI